MRLEKQLVFPKNMALNSQGRVGDVERRFAHLLNPIRDLKKNWEIDIAAYLEEYLAELEELTFSFNNGATALNFAEAALLIQGSACVYSKKVEYLYRLVFQMLELLSSSKKSSQHSSEGHQEKDNDTVSNQTKDVEFIALDDLREQTNLDLVEETSNSNKKRSGIKFLPRIPTSLIPLEESEKGKITLHNHKGEECGNKHDFRVNICHLDPSGALLLHGICYTSDLHRQPVTVLLHTSRTSQWQERNVERERAAQETELDLLEVPSSPLPSPPPPSETESLAPRRLRQRKLNENHALHTPQPIDPWKPLDPHERTPKLQRHLKRGETNRVPENIQQKIQANKKKRKRKRSKKKNTPILPVSHFCTEAYFPYSSKFPRYQNKIPQSSVFYDLYWDEVKRKKAQKAKRRLFVEEQEKENVDETEEEDMADDNSSCEDNRDPERDDDHVLLSEHEDLPFPQVDDSDNCVTVEREVNEVHLLDASQIENLPIMLSYEELVQKHVDRYLSAAAEFRQLTDLAKHVNEWEEKIKPKLELEYQRKPYDIHVYEDSILEGFPVNEKKDTILFSDYCQGKEHWEVCRYFLATLQLASNYNIKISSTGILEDGMDTMSLTLLSKIQHHDELQVFGVLSVSS